MAYKLHTYPGIPQSFKILIAAEYNNVQIDVETIEMGKKKSKALLDKTPLDKVPILETPSGCVFESNAIARYVARIRADTGLYGKTFFDSAKIDSWIDFSAHEMEVPIASILHPILGFAKFNKQTNEHAFADLKKALQILENHLLLRTYLVGESITLADITIISALIYPMKFFLDKALRKPFPCVLRWFDLCVHQPEFQAVVGDVPLCDNAITAAGQEAPAGKKKEKAATKKKEAPAPAPKPKKQEHPLAVLNKQKPSKMVMDAWKVCYSNTKPLIKSMDWFWENLDKEGYSLWFANYNYNNENTRMFMTCNAVSGFLQRSEAMRKYAFGVMDVIGEEGKEIEITGCWLFRGQTAEHMIEANPDAEYYTWTKVENFDEATKKKITEYWCNEDTLNGKPIADSKVFK